MRVFYLSDIHLRDGKGAQASRLVRFLAELPERGDLVVLGGDIFDLFVGNKEIFRGRFGKVMEGILAMAARGVGVHYLEGNHDFHFAGLFEGAVGATVHTDDFELIVGGRRIWVSHGDLIDPEDKGYRFLRAITKNSLFRGFVALAPGDLIDTIGSWSSKQSRDYNNVRGDAASQGRIRQLYADFARSKVRTGIHHVLVGHSHLRDQMPLEEGGCRGEYVNLGYASEHLRYAVLEAGAEAFALREFS